MFVECWWNVNGMLVGCWPMLVEWFSGTLSAGCDRGMLVMLGLLVETFEWVVPVE